MPTQSWQHAWQFATQAHRHQQVPGSDLPYLTHLGAVALEVIGAHLATPLADLTLAVQCAILHDCIEDQGVTPATLAAEFGEAVAVGVAALSKNATLPKAQAMADSLERIRQQPQEIWCVKLADRICNLQAPPDYWSPARIADYRTESGLILTTLGDAHSGLAARLAVRIRAYPPPKEESATNRPR